MIEPRGVRYGGRENVPPIDFKRRSAFAQISSEHWNDWQWHVLNRVTQVQDLEKCIQLSVDERRAVQLTQVQSRFSLTPHWISLMDLADTNCPIRRQGIPVSDEFRLTTPRALETVPEGIRIAGGKLHHLHADRVTLSVQSQCAVYCRFCPVKSIEAEPSGLTENDWNEIHFYLESHPQIREVVISGGEPLLLNDDVLEKIFTRLKAIRSVKVLRLETRILSVLPQRVTTGLISILKEFQPLFWVAHVNHPKEITADFMQACRLLADHGVPLASQTTLLRGVNDKVYTLSELFSALYSHRVRPYRLVQCLPGPGIEHFRTSLSIGLKLIESLRCRMSDLSLPEYVVETSGGKVPLRFETVLSRNKKRALIKNFEGKVYVYPEKFFVSSS